jgi:hypothetical protein
MSNIFRRNTTDIYNLLKYSRQRVSFPIEPSSGQLDSLDDGPNRNRNMLLLYFNKLYISIVFLENILLIVLLNTQPSPPSTILFLYSCFLGSCFRASYSKYVYEYPTRCNDILVLLKDLYMFRVPAVPIIRSTILQLAVTGMTYITLDGEMFGDVHF